MYIKTFNITYHITTCLIRSLNMLESCQTQSDRFKFTKILIFTFTLILSWVSKTVSCFL